MWVTYPYFEKKFWKKMFGRCWANSSGPANSYKNEESNRWGGAMGRPETMCPRTNFLELLVPKINRPRNTMSLHWIIPVIFIFKFVLYHAFYDRNVSFQGHCVFRDWGSQKIRAGTHRFWTSHHPTIIMHTYVHVVIDHLHVYLLSKGTDGGGSYASAPTHIWPIFQLLFMQIFNDDIYIYLLDC